jgi:tetratricopeptide (TPR) repeat protein
MTLHRGLSVWLAVFISTTTIALCQDTISSMEPKQSFARADSLMANFQYAAALSILPADDSTNIGLLLRIGLCNFRLGASEGAIKPYQQVLKLDSANVTALHQLGILYSRNSDFEAALSSFARLTQLDEKNAYYCRQAGSMAEKLEDRVSAISWYRKALRLNPVDVEATISLGNILMEMEQYKAVDSVVAIALALEPNSKPMLTLAARSAFEQKEYQSVVIIINSLLAKSDTTTFHARLLGVSYFNLQEYDKVPDCMIFLLRARMEEDWIYYYTGMSLRAMSDNESAIPWLTLAATRSISPNASAFFTQLGLSYEENKDYKNAIKSYRMAYNISQEGIFLYHLARNYDIYYKTKDEALTTYRRYLASADTTRLAREYVKRRLQELNDF